MERREEEEAGVVEAEPNKDVLLEKATQLLSQHHGEQWKSGERIDYADVMCRAAALCSESDPELSLQFLLAAVLRGSDDAHIDLAISLDEWGNKELAEDNYKSITAGGNNAALYNYGTFLYNEERWLEAIAVYELLTSENYGYEEVGIQLGECYEQLGDAVAAEGAYRMAASDPKDENAQATLGNFLRLQGRLDEAKEVLDRAREGGLDVTFEEGLLFEDLEEPDKALDCYLLSNMDESFFNAAVLLFDAGRVDEANQQLDIALSKGDRLAAKWQREHRGS